MSPKHWRPAPLALSLARGPVIGFSLVVTAVITLLFSIWLATIDGSSAQVFESQMAFTVDRFIDAIGHFEPDGIRELIRITITLDFIYPVSYAMAIGGIWSRLAGPTGWGGRAAPLAAVILAAAADWIENLLHLAAAAEMVGGSRPSTLLVLAGSIMATAKWGLLVYALLATARAALRRRGRVALAAIPLALLAGTFAAVMVLAVI